MPVAVVVALVVFLLLMAALCGVIAIWTILHDLRSAPRPTTALQAPPGGLPARPLLLPPVFAPRSVPPGVPLLPAPLPRRLVHATPTAWSRDEDDDDDYTEVELDEGVTIIRHHRLAARR